jgi:hypothetical protein
LNTPEKQDGKDCFINGIAFNGPAFNGLAFNGVVEYLLGKVAMQQEDAATVSHFSRHSLACMLEPNGLHYPDATLSGGGRYQAISPYGPACPTIQLHIPLFSLVYLSLIKTIRVVKYPLASC